MKPALFLVPLFAATSFAQSGRSPEPPLPRAPAERPAGTFQAGTAVSVPPAAGVLEVTPEMTATFKARFGAEPRIVVYVNRALFAPSTSADSPASAAATAAGSSTSSSPSTSTTPAAPAPTLADQQTVREIEMLFGRVLRAAGGTLVDQPLALQAGTRLADESAADARSRLESRADLAIEVLISTRNISIKEVSGDKVVAVPDVIATAIQLKDAKIVGQASAAQFLSRPNAAAILGVRSITEATALALLQDMVSSRQFNFSFGGRY